jgi:hypothetical protein
MEPVSSKIDSKPGDIGQAIGGAALICGGFAFALFWGVAATTLNDGIPWVATLAVHGGSILCLTFGLVTFVGPLRAFAEKGRLLALAGIAIAIVGLLTGFVLIPAGLLLLGLGLLVCRSNMAAGVLLTLGSVALLGVITVLDVRVGMEDAPELGRVSLVWFESSVLLLAAGLMTLGASRLIDAMKNPDLPQSGASA